MDSADVRAGLIPVENETNSFFTRTTVDDRKLTYRLKVIQQPLRARACGQGAKSSADRRPVDPPPIVELRVFQGEGANEVDVTFSINANYFLFATLEQARTIAHGRMSSDRQVTPVLTGTPVAGMVYLDRPAQAGYFIFPDLSVRHEGKYRLAFSLYEDLKNPKDEDKLLDPSKAAAPCESHVIHRLEVRSEPFVVFSAKKFPGLTESTELSRVFSEQGCRVRIRRDVRMRRRDTKSGAKDWDAYEDNTAQARAHAHARLSGTPDPSMYSTLPQPHGHGYMDPIPRPRSPSLASHHSYTDAGPRRPSVHDVSPGYNHPAYSSGPSPQQPQHPVQSSYAQMHSYGQPPVSHYQQAPPNYMHQQPSSMQPPASSTYQMSTSYYPYAPSATAAAPPSPAANAMQSGFDGSVPPQQTRSGEYGPGMHPADPRRSSFGGPSTASVPAYSQPTYSQQAQYTAVGSERAANGLNQAQSQMAGYAGAADAYARPAPVEPIPVASSTRAGMDLPPLNTSIMANINSTARLEASSPVSTAAPATAFSASGADSHKRSYGKVFSERHHDQPLRQGARPDSIFDNASQALIAEDDDHASTDAGVEIMRMQYRRADGRQIRRALPSHS